MKLSTGTRAQPTHATRPYREEQQPLPKCEPYLSRRAPVWMQSKLHGLESITAIASHCQALTSICLLSCAQLTNLSVTKLLQHCSTLQSLLFDYNSDMGSLDLSVQSNLQELSLMGFSSITDAAVVSIVQHCRQLTNINLSSNAALTDIAIVAIANNCALLTKLDISQTKVTDVGTAALVTMCPLLTEVCIRCSSFLTANGIFNFIEQCTNLTLFTLLMMS